MQRKVSDGQQPSTAKTTRTGKRFSMPECEKDGWIAPPYGQTSGRSTAWSGVGPWIASLPGSRASPTPQPDVGREPMIPVTSGRMLPEPLARLDPVSCSWRMFVGWLSGMETSPHTLGPSLLTLPAWGMTVGGVLYRRKRPVLPRGEIDGGAWPTPDGQAMNDGDMTWQKRRVKEKAKHQNGNGFGLTLAMAAGTWPTTTVGEAPNNHANVKAWDGLNTVTAMAEAGLWATPLPSDVSGGRTSKGKGRAAETGLGKQTLWATATVRDYRTGEQNQPVNGYLGRQAPRMPLSGRESCETTLHLLPLSGGS